ncbi:hypothetical protein [Amycolatopsis sp. FDAARGOS 1241]|uniref:hypothetical protein n=1 Tax=Amycolatopsis sp. FDAARGOS 1241 TaxID=2778070 RepID=UPI0019504CD8|nr:hypothetical protein [Amycolatopsis sp. FDAARGOS 1241]QRP48015.1 hypothetical protein I6J71_09060 [Amycolatopsis sp. FDAARGOS 1241]
MKDWIPLIVAFLGAGGVGALLDLFRARKNARKIAAETELTDANAADKLTGVALKLVEPLNSQVTALRDSLESAQAEVQQLRTQVELLTKEVAAKQNEIDRLKGVA